MATTFATSHPAPTGGQDRGTADRCAAAPLSEAPSTLAAPSRYGERDRKGLILLVAVAHALALLAILKLDVLVPHRHGAHRLVVMDIKPLAPPPPVAQPKPQPKAEVPKITVPIVAPPPIVRVATPPPPVATAPAPPPPSPQPQPVAAPAAPAIVAAVIPPDGMAATLGNVAPKYPIESRRKHEEGTVRLRVVISIEGAVQEISVARSSGFDRLDKAALDAVRRWRFRPGTQAGKPVEAVGFVPIPFVLA